MKISRNITRWFYGTQNLVHAQTGVYVQFETDNKPNETTVILGWTPVFVISINLPEAYGFNWNQWWFSPRFSVNLEDILTRISLVYQV